MDGVVELERVKVELSVDVEAMVELGVNVELVDGATLLVRESVELEDWLKDELVVLDELVDIKLLVTESVLGDDEEDDDESAPLVLVETIKLDVDVDDVVGCAEAG
jgi:hypothetical protein